MKRLRQNQNKSERKRRLEEADAITLMLDGVSMAHECDDIAALNIEGALVSPYVEQYRLVCEAIFELEGHNDWLPAKRNRIPLGPLANAAWNYAATLLILRCGWSPNCHLEAAALLRDGWLP